MLTGCRATLKEATAECLLGDGVAAIKVVTVGSLVWRSRAAFKPVFVKAAFCVSWVLDNHGRSYVCLFYRLVHVRSALRFPLNLTLIYSFDEVIIFSYKFSVEMPLPRGSTYVSHNIIILSIN